MDIGWGLTHAAGENRSIPISYGRKMVYLLKSCLSAIISLGRIPVRNAVVKYAP